MKKETNPEIKLNQIARLIQPRKVILAHGPARPTPIRRSCPICFGMGVKENDDGGTFDCPNKKCDNGSIIIN